MDRSLISAAFYLSNAHHEDWETHKDSKNKFEKQHALLCKMWSVITYDRIMRGVDSITRQPLDSIRRAKQSKDICGND